MLSLRVKIAFAIIYMSHVSLAIMRLQFATGIDNTETLDIVDREGIIDAVKTIEDYSTGRVAIIPADGPTFNGKTVEEYLRILHEAMICKGVRVVVVSFLAEDNKPRGLFRKLSIDEVHAFNELFMRFNRKKSDKSAILVGPLYMAERINNNAWRIIHEYSKLLEVMTSIDVDGGAFRDYKALQWEKFCHFVYEDNEILIP